MPLGLRGPRGIAGQSGVDGLSWNPDMRPLAINLAIVTDQDTSSGQQELGKYYRSFSSLQSAVADASVDYILIHRTKPERISSLSISRDLIISCMSDLEVITDSVNIQASVSVRGLKISTGTFTCRNNLEMIDCSLNCSSLRLIAIPNEFILMRSHMTVTSSISLNQSSLRMHDCKLSLSGISLNTSQLTSSNNVYTLDIPNVTMISSSINESTSSFSGDIFNLSENVTQFQVNASLPSSEVCNRSRLTVLPSNPSTRIDSIVDSPSSSQGVRRPAWYGYPSVKVTSSMILPDNARVFIVSGSGVIMTIPDLIEGRELLFICSSGTGRRLLTPIRNMDIPNNAVTFRVISVNGSLVELM
uniref:Uncharacterized protein n=1 Tax=viral metagenome TaxID=1070528 RepID=A0A6C0BL90_9ZZZZ